MSDPESRVSQWSAIGLGTVSAQSRNGLGKTFSRGRSVFGTDSPSFLRRCRLPGVSRCLADRWHAFARLLRDSPCSLVGRGIKKSRPGGPESHFGPAFPLHRRLRPTCWSASLHCQPRDADRSFSASGPISAQNTGKLHAHDREPEDLKRGTLMITIHSEGVRIRSHRRLHTCGRLGMGGHWR